MVDKGDNTYGGKFVVNPSGGLISKGHPLGATVIESDNVPDPPPEFSGAGIGSAENSQEDTDVDEEEATLSGSKRMEIKVEESPPGETPEHDFTTSQETVRRKDTKDVSPNKDDEETTMNCSMDPMDDFGSSVVTLNSLPTVCGEDDESTDPHEVVRIAEMYVRLGNGSTISSNGGESDSVPYIDDEFNSSSSEKPGKGRVAEARAKGRKLMIPQHSSDDKSSDGSLDIATIPPPSNAQPIEPMPMELPPQLGRSLSRISEQSSSETGPPKPDSSEEEHEDTISDPNCPTTNSESENPPSLNSDLPENVPDKDRCFSLPPLTAREVVRECGLELGAEIEFPSPPSSLMEGNQTEFTQIEADSMFLEITPPDFEEPTDDVLGAKSLPLESDSAKGSLTKDKIPYDLSISSENNVTKGEDSESSLHDSMEILEEVATVDHFERENQSNAGSEIGDDTQDLFEMPPLPSVIPVDESESSQETVLEPMYTEEIMF
eukprot:snap_masked-scaffold33_size549341-processed-gene-4.12 protein:Tk11547 transcript:snap_masked-scaffold33_size549341-processed-gene-4.12-mRNA-1 annotation:"hypothetical protein SMAC_06395"